ncbi:MAG: hypothetical protein WAT92_02625 [Saprospiraceae bacterium]
MKIVHLLFILLYSIPSFCQKISFKDGSILVDKVEKYKVEKLEKGGFSGLSKYSFIDISGNEILTFTDTVCYLTQLPNEKEKREYLRGYNVTSPLLKRSVIIPGFRAMNFGKQLSKDLEDINFFQTEQFTNEIFDKYLSKKNNDLIKDDLIMLDSINILRVINYELTKKIFEPLTERTPLHITVEGNVIKDGYKAIGKIIMQETGSHATNYHIINSSKSLIAGFTIVPSNGKANVRPVIDERKPNFNRSNVKIFYLKYGVPDSVVFTEMATYLIHMGYL